MASRIAQKKKRMDEEDIGVIARRKVTAPSSSIADIKSRAKAENIAKAKQEYQGVIVPQSKPDLESAPVNPPTTIQTREDLSNSLKDFLQPKQETKPDVLAPPRETISNTQNIRYDPQTDGHKIVETTPIENLKTIESVINKTTQQPEAIPVMDSRATIEARLPKRSYETPQQYSERIDRVITQEQQLASKGISSSDRASAIVKQAEAIAQKRQDDLKGQAQVEQAYFNDPWVKERLAMKEQRAKEDAFFNPIVQGLTDTMDVLVHALPILGGSAGGVLAQAYKNFAPPTSQFYQDKAFEDKTISFLKDNVADKVKDLGTGIAMSQIKNGVNLVKGYKGVNFNKVSADKFGNGVRGVNNPVATLTEGSQMYVPKTAPSMSSINVGKLPAKPVQAPQRLQAQRTDTIISPRTNVVRR